MRGVMSLEVKFILFQILIIVPFVGGSLIRSRLKDSALLAKRVITVNLTSVEPFVVLWSIWGLDLQRQFFILPLAGLSMVLVGFLLGMVLVLPLRRRERSRSTYIISSSLANHGFTMGGFLCYLFGGLDGLGLSAIFLIYFLPFTFLFIFPYAGMSGSGRGLKNLFSPAVFKEFFLTPRNMPLYASVTALVLQGAGVKRPDIPFPADIFLMVTILLYYFSLGINFRLSDIRAVGMEQVTMACSKFILLPLITWGILQVIDFSRPVESVILLESFMPAAVYSVLSSILFDLDVSLASALFVINTVLFILLVLPLLFILGGGLLF